MSRQESESKPMAERLLPQTSIRFFVFLIGVCAVTMFVFRAAFLNDQLWAQCLAVVIVTAVACFAAYVLMFFAAMLFSSVGLIAGGIDEDGPVRAVGSGASDRALRPNAEPVGADTGGATGSAETESR